MKKSIFRREEPKQFHHVDTWVPENPERLVFRETKGVLIAPIHLFYNLDEDNTINYFYLTVKKCYNSDTKIGKDGELKEGFRCHLTKYLNYFEEFYDTDHMLLGIYSKIKYLIDCYGSQYTEDVFISDLNRHIISPDLNPILHYYLNLMNEDNYIPLRTKTRDVNPSLEYKNIHLKLLMIASMISNMLIPLLSHYMYRNKYSNEDVKRILLAAFDNIYIMIQNKYGVNLYAKLYDTIITNIQKSKSRNIKLWNMNVIRGINPLIHANEMLSSIIIQIVPKYIYSSSAACFNYNAIQKDIQYKVEGISYEFNGVPISSSIRDDDNNSQTDKFEAHIIKTNEALSMQFQINAYTTMQKIENLYGPFNQKEIDYYIKRLTEDGKSVKTTFQTYLIYNLFIDEFGDKDSIRYINNEEYVKLMIAAKKILSSYKMFTLAEIVGGKVEKTIARKNINKNMFTRIKMSENYPKVRDKYKDETIIEDNLFSLIAQTTASEFSFISYEDRNRDRAIIPIDKTVICEEYLLYALLIK